MHMLHMDRSMKDISDMCLDDDEHEGKIYRRGITDRDSPCLTFDNFSLSSIINSHSH
jgi:hypothetical protein